MHYDNPFVLEKAEYKRSINVRRDYEDDATFYLSTMTGRTADQARHFVKKVLQAEKPGIPGGMFAFKDPTVFYLERGENGDRSKKKGTMSEYLRDSIAKQHLIAPTFTTYLSAKEKQALLVDYIDDNVKARGVAKKAMFKAKVAGDKLLEATKKIEQNLKKINNNSISGAHCSPGTPLYNPTAHSTLTSCCRCTSGYGNANNEKFLCGNRHYWSADITRNNIVSVVNHSDYKQINAVMQKYDLRHPSVEETIEMLRYSTDLYWTSENYFDPQFERIEQLIKKLSPIQRSAFVYTGDLYHLAKFNGGFVRNFITQLATLVEVEHQDPDSVFANSLEDHRHLAAQIFRKEMKGVDFNKIKGTSTYAKLASTTENITNTLETYRDLIRAFWVTPNVPASLGYLPQSIRRAAITSDTDSTIFTVQDWVKWHTGRIGFDDFSRAIAATMIFLAAQTITHILARMSANFGVEEKRLHQIAMKNEFAFDVFVATQVAKHYYAFIGCQEGNLFAEHEKEIKGVHLKSSKAPKAVMKQAEAMMINIMKTIMDEKLIDIHDIMKEIADLERSVMASIRKGSYEYFSFAQINTADSYSKGEFQSNYIHYRLWDEVFAPKYGSVGAPPYVCVKVSTALKSPAALQRWMDGFEDRELAERMKTFITKTGRKNMNTFWLPVDIVSASGIPDEIYRAINVRKIVFETTKVFYLILETLGVYMLNKKMTRLVSDFH